MAVSLLSPLLLLPGLQSVFSSYFICCHFPSQAFSSHFLAFSSLTPACAIHSPLFSFNLPLSFHPPFCQPCLPLSYLFHSSFLLLSLFFYHLSHSFFPPLSPSSSPLSAFPASFSLSFSSARTLFSCLACPFVLFPPHPASHSRLLLMIKAKTSHQ